MSNPDSLLVTVAQLNPTVGALDDNTSTLIDAYTQAADGHADVLVGTELAVTGYPPEDLLSRAAFIEDAQACVHKIAAITGNTTAIFGSPERVPARRFADANPRFLTNAAHLCRDGHRFAMVEKVLLPDYAVFDETRNFLPGEYTRNTDTINGVPYGVLICEDLWTPDLADRHATDGARILFVLNASPYETGKQRTREKLVTGTADRCGVPVVYVNQVGGQDGTLFDGRSMVACPGVGLIWQGPAWEPCVTTVNVPLHGNAQAVHPTPPRLESDVWDGISLGVRDYVHKNRFTDVVIGLSGGIDSAVVAAIAVDALGAEHVRGIGMPGPFSSEGSVSDAQALADTLGIHFDIVPIGAMYDAAIATLHDPGRPLEGTPFGVVEENLQARLRGMTLMAVSNQTGALVLNTSNKSESAVGYTTLYGDMAGGFAPIADCPKTLVYQLARWRNRVSPVIPKSTITKPPSAELAPGQVDSNSLPPYDVLDAILHAYVDEDRSPAQITASGVASEQTVRRVCRMVDRAEYKRRQASPGVKITSRVYGRDRRVPITQAYT